ncbi:MAG: ATP-binding cassette domain-containing protein [Thermomicrobiales bacterium]|nr:ATP-binding cassette domain-containing protein [Thermomicrobiales bacterium]
MSVPLLQVEHLSKHYPIRSGLLGRRATGTVRALDDVSFTLEQGETLGVVGESGCGKSTLARTMLWLDEPTGGSVRFRGETIGKNDLATLRKEFQIVFQDPYTSLPPRMRVRDIVADPLEIHGPVDGETIPQTVERLLREVGLDPARAGQYPFQFSGGQRQRIGIARALAVNPAVVCLDESVSALDVSVQAQVLNLLRDLQQRHGLAYLFISHDLSVVRYLSDRIAVMYLGRIVEEGPADALARRPLHPYTVALLEAAPSLKRSEPARIALKGEPPSPSNPPAGCAFHPRCPMAADLCRSQRPELAEWLPGRRSACHFALDVPAILGKAPV